MTDRELLELAAKAAGIPHGADRIDSGLSLTTADGRHESFPQWNPLTDDGDALRLAAALSLDVYIHQISVAVNFGTDKLISERCSGAVDRAAATRRAIVRAAAEIGENR